MFPHAVCVACFTSSHDLFRFVPIVSADVLTAGPISENFVVTAVFTASHFCWALSDRFFHAETTESRISVAFFDALSFTAASFSVVAVLILSHVWPIESASCVAAALILSQFAMMRATAAMTAMMINPVGLKITLAMGARAAPRPETKVVAAGMIPPSAVEMPVAKVVTAGRAAGNAWPIAFTHVATVPAIFAASKRPFTVSIPAPIAITILPLPVSNKPAIRPLATSQMIATTSPRILPHSMFPRNSPIDRPTATQSVILTVSSNVSKMDVIKLLTDLPDSAQSMPFMALLRLVAIWNAISFDFS